MDNPFFPVVSSIVLLSSIWVLVDTLTLGARKGLIKGFFDMGPFAWFMACLLFWLICFPAYLVHRPQLKRAAEAAKRAQLSGAGHAPGFAAAGVAGSVPPGMPTQFPLPFPCPNCGPSAALLRFVPETQQFFCAKCQFWSKKVEAK